MIFRFRCKYGICCDYFLTVISPRPIYHTRSQTHHTTSFMMHCDLIPNNLNAWISHSHTLFVFEISKVPKKSPHIDTITTPHSTEHITIESIYFQTTKLTINQWLLSLTWWKWVYLAWQSIITVQISKQCQQKLHVTITFHINHSHTVYLSWLTTLCDIVCVIHWWSHDVVVILQCLTCHNTHTSYFACGCLYFGHNCRLLTAHTLTTNK